MIPETSVWSRAQMIELQVTEKIESGFNIGFDKIIPETVQSKLRTFVEWIESNYRIPITFWVDFDYKHYLIRKDGKHVGYLFYWSDFDSYPMFNKPEDIPELRLAVRDERWTIKQILTSFIEAIMCYYAWICNEIDGSYEPIAAEVEEILQEYLRSGKV